MQTSRRWTAMASVPQRHYLPHIQHNKLSFPHNLSRLISSVPKSVIRFTSVNPPHRRNLGAQRDGDDGATPIRYTNDSRSATKPKFHTKHDKSVKAINDDKGRNQRKAHSPKVPISAGLVSDVFEKDLVNIHSLKETLEAHRKVNSETPVIRRLYRDQPPHLKLNTARPPFEWKHLELEREDAEGLREEYKGEVRGLNFSWMVLSDVPRYVRLPWMRGLDQAGPSDARARMRLSAEIKAVDAFLTPTPSERIQIRSIVKGLNSWLLNHRPNWRFDLIGSWANGLASPASDIDLNLVIPNQSLRKQKLDELLNSTPSINSNLEPSTLTGFAELAKLYKDVKAGKEADNPLVPSYFASRARVPIIAALHRKTGLEVQIQSADSGYASLEVSKSLAVEHPNLRPLFKLLKHAFKMRAFHVGIGGITSYPLLNMIAVSLKLKSRGPQPNDLALDLLNFLDFWSDINFYETGITHIPSRELDTSPRPPGTVYEYFEDQQAAIATIDAVAHDPMGARPVLFEKRKELAEVHVERSDFMMVLHDPANPYNDLGRSATQIKNIQTTLIDIRLKLKQDMQDWNDTIRAEGHSTLRPPSLLRSLIEGDHTFYNLERKRVAEQA